MSSIDIALEPAPVAAAEEPWRKRLAPGWLASLLLHAVGAALLFALLKPGGGPGADRVHFVPVMIVTWGGGSNAPHSGKNTAPVKAPTTTVAHREASARAPTHLGIAPKVTPKDDMDAKLE